MEKIISRVLILVVMEDGLVPTGHPDCKRENGVLILVVVEDGLVRQFMHVVYLTPNLS